jgi:SAM-dependent methyltransferase
MLKLNIGCGPNKIEGYVNIDSVASVEPDLVHDVMKETLPYADSTVNEILFFHCIEHVRKCYHEVMLKEFMRVLEPGGVIYISYPDFESCAKNWIINKNGMRKFWEATIFGRQLHEGDYHVCAMSHEYLADVLMLCGFTNIISTLEPNELYNKITSAYKPPSVEINYEHYEDILRTDTQNMVVEVK